MDTGIDKEKIEQYKALAVKHLSDPIKLRLTVIGLSIVVGMFAIYNPMSKKIQAGRSGLSAEKRRFEAVRDVEILRKEIESYDPRIPQQSDTNEWVQYILDGLRETRLKLRDMESRQPMKVGPFRTVTLSVEVEGVYPKLQQFVEWLETSDRLLRVDSIRFEKQPDTLVMKVIILGLARKNAKQG